MSGTQMSDTARVWQRCDACGHRLPDDDPSPECPLCHGLLAIEHPTPDQSAVSLRARFDARCCMTSPGSMRSGVWRFADIVHPSADQPVSYPEGNTPLLERDAVRRFAGCNALLLKHEGMNPTGSFKDRGMTVGVTQAKRLGARAVACASTGNTSASLASYAALAGIPALVFVPAGQIALGKLTQTLAYGARTLLVRGDFDACLSLVRESSSRLGIYLLNSINPWRLEGQKTIVFELLQQLRWEPPEWIALPAGNLGNISAFGKALREAYAWGLITRVPRLLAVQAEGASPFYRSFRDGFEVRHRMKADTVATAIKIGDPASYDRAVATVRETNGVVVQVSGRRDPRGQGRDRCRGHGVRTCQCGERGWDAPPGATGVIGANERVVAILTGHVLKDPGVLQWYHQEASPAPVGANPPIEIEPTIAAVERVLQSS